MKWVTRERPVIDRIACPWLVLRFLDPNARFLFVAPSEVLAVAERFDAIPFDIEGVRFSHRGDLCSFDAFLADFGLQTISGRCVVKPPIPDGRPVRRSGRLLATGEPQGMIRQ